MEIEHLRRLPTWRKLALVAEMNRTVQAMAPAGLRQGHPDDEVVRSRWERWDSENRHIAAPTGLHYEFSNALCRYQRTGMMSRAAVRLALIAALSLPLQLHGDAELHTRALDLAEHLSLPAAYDAHYVALADWLGAEFWTADQRLAGAMQGGLPWVRVVEASS